MRVLRTPEHNFDNLSGYGFEANYYDYNVGNTQVRIHYLDEQNETHNRVYLCLHGEPTWSYLYRKMLPVFSKHGRIVTPDLMGFGKSDKPAEESFYTFDVHRNMLIDFIKRLDLKNITLVCQDWGGLLGLTLPMEFPGRFSSLLVMNTTLATGEEGTLSTGFEEWKSWINQNPNLNIAKLMKRAEPTLTDDEANAYEVPFPDATFKAGVRAFPNLVPTTPNSPGADISRKATEWWKSEWQGKSFMAIGMKDPVLGLPVMERLRNMIRGCPEPMKLENTGHFIQEHGKEIAQRALEAFNH